MCALPEGGNLNMNKYLLQERLFNLYAGMYFLSMYFFEKKNATNKRLYQRRKVKKLLQNAYQLPIYKRKFDEAGVTPADFHSLSDLTKFPALTKEEYRSWMQEELKTEEAKYYKTTKTSGSTGIPTTNIFPPKEYAHHYMADFFCWWLGGYNPFFGLSMTKQPADPSVGMRSLIQRFGVLRRECFDTGWDRRKIVEKINEVKPDFITASSSELLYIAQYILENDLEITRPSYFCPMGENIDGRTEEILKSVYGKGLINAYGGKEMADFAVKKPGSHIYEIIESLAVVCIKDEYGQLAAKGSGSLLVTPLFRERYPLINYELGDYVELGERDGRDCIFRITGRCDENGVFTWKSGKQTIFIRLFNITSELKDIFQILFIQKSNEKVIIQVVKDKKTNKTIEELEEYLRKQYKNEFDDDTVIEFEWKDIMPPDKNGKLRIMVSEIKE